MKRNHSTARRRAIRKQSHSKTINRSKWFLLNEKQDSKISFR
ncbi:hypothetical protein [Paraferrimonas haliotis]|nr:hypothetical protein [Paraferrimonas haliotis]